MRWRKWIKACISNIQYFIIINGKPHGRLNSTRGIRQGDPISPFLFVIAIDYLSRLLNHLEDRRAIKGVVLNDSYSFNHLLFANGILIFVEDNDKYLSKLHFAIKLFEMASRLKINTTKSTISPINVNSERTKVIANVCALVHQNLLVKYLGTPLRGKPQSKAFWENSIEKVHTNFFTRNTIRFPKGVGLH